MKNKKTAIIIAVLLIIVCVFAFVIFGNGNKLSEEIIKNSLMDSEGKIEGTLTIDSGSAQNVKAFSYTVNSVNTSQLTTKSYVKSAVEKLAKNPGSVTYAEFKVCKAFNAVMNVIGIFYSGKDFDSKSFTEDILSIISDGNSKTYQGWTVKVDMDKNSDSITIKATRN